MRMAIVIGVLAASVAAQRPVSQVPPPVPKPFPQPGQPTISPTAKTPPPAPTGTTPAQAAAPVERPTGAMLGGAPVYPGAEYLDALDAGRGQRYFLYGTTDAYADVVAFYKQQLKNGGRELFKAPAMQQFDLGVKFQEETMAYPPSIIVKDYTWNNSPGYLHISGTMEKRFATIIQIVPAPMR